MMQYLIIDPLVKIYDGYMQVLLFLWDVNDEKLIFLKASPLISLSFNSTTLVWMVKKFVPTDIHR